MRVGFRFGRAGEDVYAQRWQRWRRNRTSLPVELREGIAELDLEYGEVRHQERFKGGMDIGGEDMPGHRLPTAGVKGF